MQNSAAAPFLYRKTTFTHTAGGYDCARRRCMRCCLDNFHVLGYNKASHAAKTGPHVENFLFSNSYAV